MAGEPSFFEIGVEDAVRARAFYGELFGWRFEDLGETGGAAISTTGLLGGVHGNDPGASPYLFFRVDDLDAAIAEVRRLGGSLEETPGVERAEPTPYGRFALCRDDQGSGFGLHEPPPPASR